MVNGIINFKKQTDMFVIVLFFSGGETKTRLLSFFCSGQIRHASLSRRFKSRVDAAAVRRRFGGGHVLFSPLSLLESLDLKWIELTLMNLTDCD